MAIAPQKGHWMNKSRNDDNKEALPAGARAEAEKR
jgi:hypothetical protein